VHSPLFFSVYSYIYISLTEQMASIGSCKWRLLADWDFRGWTFDSYACMQKMVIPGQGGWASSVNVDHLR